MSECRNEDLRDLLPDLAAERLASSERARVASHVATCAACTAELELLRAARRVMSRGVPVVDVARIVAALPHPPVAADARPALVASSEPVRAVGARGAGRDASRGAAPARGAAPRRYLHQWGGWRIAAAATIVVGGLSVAVLRQLRPSTDAAPVIAPAIGPAGAPETPAVTPAPRVPGQPSVPGETPVGPSPTSPSPGTEMQAGAGLAVAGDISELSDGDVETLLQDMNALDGQPSADPDASVPAISGAVSP
jgi:hypothetical protein